MLKECFEFCTNRWAVVVEIKNYDVSECSSSGRLG